MLLATLASFFSFAQPQGPQGQQRQPRPQPSPQNAFQRSAPSQDPKFVDRVAYNAYADANTHVNGAEVVFIGDSITQNWYNFHQDFFDKNGFIARGISGQTSISILCRFHPDVIDHNPKVAVILCGTNDVAQNDGPIDFENFIDNIAAMCDQAKAHDIKVLLCSITPCDYFPWNQEMTPGPVIMEVNEKLKEYAASAGIRYVDYFQLLNNGKDGMIDEYTFDRCHPTALGYNVMERLIVKEINKAMGTNKEYYVTP